MKNNRREFIKLTGIAGAGMVAGCSQQSNVTGISGAADPFPQTHRQSFNMSGYAAPKIDTVRVGIIGIGNRGRSMVRAFALIDKVEIKAISDVEPERVDWAINTLKDYPRHKPDTYTGSEDAWKKLCERNDIDLVYICTPWALHTPMAVYAMEHDKHAATERPFAKTVDECWQLVETSERTRKHCSNMTQSAHSGLKAVALNMVRQGFFGNIIHGEGCYIHELNNDEYLFDKEGFHKMWRLKENGSRNGNLYTPSGIDGVALMMDINCGEKLEYMVSVSGNDFSLGENAKEHAAGDSFYEPYVNMPYRGNMNVSVIRTNKGRTIMIQHDVSSPRPRPTSNSLISGTKGIFMFHNEAPAIATNHMGWISEEEFKSLMDKYTPAMVKRYDELIGKYPEGARYVRPMDWRLIDCLRNGLPLDMSVYDGALWCSLSPLSEWSVANSSNSVKIPDFTNGAWQTNKRGMDLELQNGGGTTKLG